MRATDAKLMGTPDGYPEGTSDGRIQLTDEDIRLGSALFKAYRNKDKTALNIFANHVLSEFNF